jgi:hypothetical protein
MANAYQARWVSKGRKEALRKSSNPGRVILLDSLNGFLAVEPVGSNLGDGPVLSPEEAAFELTPAWCTGSKAKLIEARRLLGLEAIPPASTLAEVAVL